MSGRIPIARAPYEETVMRKALAGGGREAMILHNGMPVELLEFAHKGKKP